jgi:uncharacterized SAM-binding protein YcdF (DUF218 family)
MTWVRQILPLFFMPVGLTLLLVAGGLYFRRRAPLFVAGALLWLNSTPVVSGLLLRALERSAVRIPAASAPIADAIVVLGGGRIVTPGPAAIYEWREPDRFYGGVELAKAQRAPVLIFTSVVAPSAEGTPRSGDILARYAAAMGVPAGQTLATRPARNTAEEARVVAALLGERHVVPAGRSGPARILLVTSAFHMARARTLFQRAGIAVTPFPVEFQHWENERLGVMDFFPSAEALKQAELAWHEMYGRLYYRVFR